MNRSTMWKGLLALSLALNLGTITAVLVQQARPAQNATAAPLNVPDYLGLGLQQRERWQQLEPAFLRDLAANVIAQLLAERDLLDAPQREKLMNLLLSRYAQESTEEEQLHRH